MHVKPVECQNKLQPRPGAVSTPCSWSPGSARTTWLGCFSPQPGGFQSGVHSFQRPPVLCSVFLVFEYCAHDLARLLDVGGVRFEVGEVKALLQQLLRAVAFLHSRWIIHRDLKLSNLLLTDRREVLFSQKSRFCIPG